MNWREQLQPRLRSVRRLAVLGAGSVLCGDDAAGMLLAERLQAHPRHDLLALAGSTAPENFTGQIKDFAPELLLIVDAAFIGREVGEIALIEADQVKGVSFSTHMLPFTVLIDYLRRETGIETLIVGIQPGPTEFATEPGPLIVAAAEQLADFLLGFYPE